MKGTLHITIPTPWLDNHDGTLGLVSVVDLHADTALKFIAKTPCRVADTRASNGALGSPDLIPGMRDFPILASDCGMPATAVAYSLNVTAIPKTTLGYLTVYATGAVRPATSTLNAWNGGVVANGVMVSAGTGGSITVYTIDETELILDLDGYYLPAAAGPRRCRTCRASGNLGSYWRHGSYGLDRCNWSCPESAHLFSSETCTTRRKKSGRR